MDFRQRYFITKFWLRGISALTLIRFLQGYIYRVRRSGLGRGGWGSVGCWTLWFSSREAAAEAKGFELGKIPKHPSVDMLSGSIFSPSMYVSVWVCWFLDFLVYFLWCLSCHLVSSFHCGSALNGFTCSLLTCLSPSERCWSRTHLILPLVCLGQMTLDCCDNKSFYWPSQPAMVVRMYL